MPEHVTRYFLLPINTNDTLKIYIDLSKKLGAELQEAVSHEAEKIRGLKDQNGLTVLHHAAKFGRIDILTSILELRINANISDYKGCTPLFYAAEAGKVEPIKVLIKYGADVNHQNLNWTPITLAAGKGHLEAIKTLIDNNADIDVIHPWNQSPISFACLNNHPEILDFLIKEGADCDLNKITDLVIRNDYHKKVVEALIEHGASMAKMLETAIYYKKYDLAKFIIIEKMPARAYNGCANDDHPLFIAAKIGCAEIMKYTLDHYEKDINHMDYFEKTPLFYAVEDGMFIEAAGPDYPLGSYFIKNEKTEITTAILKCGADVNRTDNYLNTPLHIATMSTSHSSIERVKLLLKHGANVNHQNEDGETPLDIAANVNDQNDYDETPLDIAAFKNSVGIAKLLIEHGATSDISESKIASELSEYITAQQWCNGSNINTEISEPIKKMIKTIITNKLAQNPSILDDSLTAKLQKLEIGFKDIYNQCATNSIKNAVDGLWNPFYKRLLIMKDIQVNQQEETKQPDNIAAGEGHLEADIETLIDNNTDSDIMVYIPYKPAHSFACLNNYPKTLDFLIDDDDDQSKVNAITNLVNNAADHAKVVEALIEQRISMTEMLKIAIYYKNYELAKFIITEKMPAGINEHGGANDDHPLFIVAKIGCAEIMKYTSTHYKKDINLIDTCGKTALFYALDDGVFEEATLPIDPLGYYLIKNEKTETTEELLKQGADVNYKNTVKGNQLNGIDTPLNVAMRAKSHSSIKRVELLLKHGANPNDHNVNSYTPLHIAAKCTSNCSIKKVELLLKHGADVNYNAYSYSPLKLAASEKNAKIAKLLIEHGATADICSFDIASSLREYITAQQWCNGSNINTGISEQAKKIIKTIITNKLAQNPSILDDSLTAKLQELGIEAKDIYDQHSKENGVDILKQLPMMEIQVKQQEETKQSDVQDITEILSVVTVEDTPVTAAAEPLTPLTGASEETEHC